MTRRGGMKKEIKKSYIAHGQKTPVKEKEHAKEEQQGTKTSQSNAYFCRHTDGTEMTRCVQTAYILRTEVLIYTYDRNNDECDPFLILCSQQTRLEERPQQQPTTPQVESQRTLSFVKHISAFLFQKRCKDNSLAIILVISWY